MCQYFPWIKLNAPKLTSTSRKYINLSLCFILLQFLHYVGYVSLFWMCDLDHCSVINIYSTFDSIFFLSKTHFSKISNSKRKNIMLSSCNSALFLNFFFFIKVLFTDKKTEKFSALPRRDSRSILMFDRLARLWEVVQFENFQHIPHTNVHYIF